MHTSDDRASDRVERLQSLRIDRQGAGRTIPWGWIIVAVAVLGVTIGAGAQYHPLSETSGAPAPALQVAASVPAPAEIAPTRPDWIVAGYLVARRESLVSSEVTGRVSRLMVVEGNIVDEGDVIAHLDSTLANADWTIAKARVDASARSIDAAEAELIEAQRALDRTRQLVARDHSSEAELDKKEARFEVLTAQYEKAKADQAIVSLEADRAAAVLAMHTITAPFSGTVSGCAVDVGETVSPMSSHGTARDGICSIVDTSSIEVELEVPEKMLDRVPLGTKVQVVLDAFPDDGLTASVREIAPVVDRAKSTIKVRLGFEEIDPRLRPNMAVKVNLEDGVEEIGQ